MAVLMLSRPTSAADVAGSLEDLMVAVASGDRAAYSQLYDEIADTVYGLARKVVVDPSRAQEIAQDVLFEVWQKADRFDPERGSAITWIAVMTRRRAIDVVRSAESSRKREERVTKEPGSHPDPVGDGIVDREDQHRVRSAMASLSDLQREALELAFYHDLSHSQVADALGAPLGTVKTRIRDGLKRLSAEMGGLA
jgi:RNA polymerase sigma-70 factor (ECF subfamily)